YLQNIKGSICKESPYSFDGTLLDSSGSYTFNYYTVNGCDSIIIIDLTVLKSDISNLNYQICSGDQIIVSGKIYSIPGLYTDTLKNVNNCDSILEISIVENKNYISLIDTSICNGSFINIGKKNYFVSGTYEDTLSTKFLCDSIVNLNLTVHNSNYAKLDTSICEGNSVNISGIKYQTNGIFSIANKNVFGCDSTIELDLKVNKVYSMTNSTSICEGDFFEIANQKYTKSGQYNIILRSQHGCDSSIQLNLLVHPIKQFTLDTTICFNQKLVVANKILDSSGVYDYVEKSSNGCDSLVSIKLKINSALVVNEAIQTLKCLGDQNAEIEVKSSGGQMPYQYRWSNGEKSSLLKDLKAGTYTVTVSDQLSCPLLKTFEIIDPECFCFEVLTSSGSCLDLLPNKIDIQQKSGKIPFNYLLNGSSVKPTNNSIEGITNGHYSLEIMDSLGCTYSKEMDFKFDNSYIQDLGVDTVYATVGDSIVLKTNSAIPNVFVNNSWTRSGILICTNCYGNKVQAGVGTNEYTYEGIDENGCEIEYKLYIIAKQNFNVPNVFSPNG
ncbi:MAG: SprB repeat-containing protein, partial [Saprospiraceae bacterium]